jgi:putative tryptophan/tyrosine transport system substrate-binding protein
VINRRALLRALVGGLLATPFASRPQQAAMPVVGWISSRSASESAYLVAAFRQGLKEAGYIENQNVSLDFRWGEGQYDRLLGYATELVRRPVNVIVATGGDPAAQAAKAATATIPIVFVSGSDPVKVGLVASLNRPGGNITGIHVMIMGLGAKRLGLLHELMPAANPIGVLMNPNFVDAQTQLRDIEDAAQSLGLKLLVFQARTELEIETAFANLTQQKVGAIFVVSDPFFTSRRVQLVTLAARHAIPATYQFREFAASGGLMSYGASLVDAYRQGGIYVGKILKGAKPGDLPIEQPTKFELTINLKTAKALGLTIPQSLLLRADEVIQ